MLKNCMNKLSRKTQTVIQDSAAEIVVEKNTVLSNDVSIT